MYKALVGDDRGFESNALVGNDNVGMCKALVGDDRGMCKALVSDDNTACAKLW